MVMVLVGFGDADRAAESHKLLYITVRHEQQVNQRTKEERRTFYFVFKAVPSITIQHSRRQNSS